MKPMFSVRKRLLLLAVLVAFAAGITLAVRRANKDGPRSPADTARRAPEMSPENIEAFKKSLTDAPGHRVTVAYSMNDTNASRLGDKLCAIFAEAGFQVDNVSFPEFQPGHSGLKLKIRVPDTTQKKTPFPAWIKQTYDGLPLLFGDSMPALQGLIEERDPSSFEISIGELPPAPKA